MAETTGAYEVTFGDFCCLLIDSKLCAQIQEEFETSLSDYKFYCFDGKVEFLMINTGRNSSSGTRADYFDRDFNHLDFKWGYDHADTMPSKPVCFDEMIEIAEVLSKEIPELCVDLYVVNKHIYFGELTFFNGSRFEPFEPDEWDIKMGEFLKLPDCQF